VPPSYVLVRCGKRLVFMRYGAFRVLNSTARALLIPASASVAEVCDAFWNWDEREFVLVK
jgi:hypothetical protein